MRVPDCKGDTYSSFHFLHGIDMMHILAGDKLYFDAVQELCGELCNLDKEVTKQEKEFLGSVRSKVRPLYIIRSP